MAWGIEGPAPNGGGHAVGVQFAALPAQKQGQVLEVLSFIQPAPIPRLPMLAFMFEQCIGLTCSTARKAVTVWASCGALVVTLDFPSATKMDVAENRARTVVLPSVAYQGGGGGTGHKTHSRLNGTPSKVWVGGSCSPNGGL